ncbi:MAG: DNA polymerase IV [Methanobacteriota archaeon]|nr:MAG: DNA polymerase IV [Euryarchaeota archaeon]
MVHEKRRIILHVDMDHFFTAVEEREHPEYAGKPVVVGADPKAGRGRGVVSTCNYKARAYGLRSGMPISRAWKLCPEAVYLPVNMPLYKKVSDRIMEILRRYADKFEQCGIDEAFLDVSSVGSFGKARKIAEKIKKEVFEREKLTCSIGVGPNKLVAKMASDAKKPDGLTVVKEEDVKGFLSPMPVGKLWGIGKKTEQKLNEMGIRTIGQLASADSEKLAVFGVWGERFRLLANGIDNREVEERKEVKSMSREHTFEEDTSDEDLILETLYGLCGKLCKALENSNLFCGTITTKIRYENFETHTHSKTLPLATNSLDEIRRISTNLLKPFLVSGRRVRLVGVKLSNFSPAGEQKTL